MPIKKLVELNGEYGGWLEIDPVRLNRLAWVFKDWLEKNVVATDDPLGFLDKDLPIVLQALDGTLTLPCRYEPHSWELRERTLPADYMRVSSPFYNTIRGSLDAPPEVIMKDGRYYAWTEWEDPSDSENSK